MGALDCVCVLESDFFLGVFLVLFRPVSSWLPVCPFACLGVRLRFVRLPFFVVSFSPALFGASLSRSRSLPRVSGCRFRSVASAPAVVSRGSGAVLLWWVVPASVVCSGSSLASSFSLLRASWRLSCSRRRLRGFAPVSFGAWLCRRLRLRLRLRWFR